MRIQPDTKQIQKSIIKKPLSQNENFINMVNRFLDLCKNQGYGLYAMIVDSVLKTMDQQCFKDFKRVFDIEVDRIDKYRQVAKEKDRYDQLLVTANNMQFTIAFALKNLFKPQKGFNTKINGRSVQNDQRERKERYFLKGYDNGEKLFEDLKQARQDLNTKNVSLYSFNQWNKEKNKKNRIEKAKQRKASKKDQEKLKDIKLYNLPINKLHTKIGPNSVDLILTDPPYEKQALPLFKELSHFAGKVLKPGGSLLCMSGNMYLPEVIDNLRDCKKIHYHFLCSYVMDGPTSQEHSLKVFVSSKPIIWFTKGAYNGEAINNTIKPDKSCESSNQYHKWGQSVDGFLKILEKNFVFPGDVICDPFLGAGATAIASYKHGCKFIGSDIDPECIKTTNGRLVEVVQNTKD